METGLTEKYRNNVIRINKGICQVSSMDLADDRCTMQVRDWK